jgi:hypothetical protein
MARIAKHVETEPAAIARIENLACELPTHARVRITTCDGDAGTVAERPAVMLFDDINGNCGINGLVRFDTPQSPPSDLYLWLSDIARVEPLDIPGQGERQGF